MNRSKTILFITVLALISGTAILLAHAKSNQRLGLPGVKTRPLAGSQNLEVMLPVDLAGFQSQSFPQTAAVTNLLPRDTSYGMRIYQAGDGFWSQVNVVLMGSSRSSIHQPEICLTGQGWTIDYSSSRVEQIHMDKPKPYSLPVMRLNAKRDVEAEGQRVTQKGIYLYWFVDADEYTAVHSHRMLLMAQDMILKDVLDRWAYISFFSVCGPGQEDATYDRMKQLINLSVPEFQLVPGVK